MNKIRRQPATPARKRKPKPGVHALTPVAFDLGPLEFGTPALTPKVDHVLKAKPFTTHSSFPRKQPQRQNKRWREEQLLPVLYKAYPDWRNGIPNKAELKPHQYLVKCRLAVWTSQSTRHLLSSANSDCRLDKTFKRLRDGR